jgi:hypothetical protein
VKEIVGLSRANELDVLEHGKVVAVENAALSRLLLNRNIVGAEFSSLCAQSTISLLHPLRDDLERSASSGIAELLILSKGLCYELSASFARLFDRSLDINLIGTRRAEVMSEHARIDISYSRLDTSATTLLVGDTVASGSTICAALDHVVAQTPINRLILVSFACSLRGLQVIDRYCKAHGIDLIAACGLGLMGLGENGFDLSFVHPDALCAERYRDKWWELFQGKAVSNVGWDFGAQSLALAKYRNLCWIEAELWQLHKHHNSA